MKILSLMWSGLSIILIYSVSLVISNCSNDNSQTFSIWNIRWCIELVEDLTFWSSRICASNSIVLNMFGLKQNVNWNLWKFHQLDGSLHLWLKRAVFQQIWKFRYIRYVNCGQGCSVGVVASLSDKFVRLILNIVHALNGLFDAGNQEKSLVEKKGFLQVKNDGTNDGEKGSFQGFWWQKFLFLPFDGVRQ